jgi:UDP-glucose 4-epimerase
MRTLVTGGCGFIGSHLVERLINDGHEVIVIDDLSADNDAFHAFEGAKYVHASITEDTIEPYFKDVDHVFHLAADARIQPSILNPRHAAEVNIMGTLNVLQACHKNKVKRIIYSSTSSVYGLTDKIPTDENVPYNCLNPYASTKLGGEELVKCFTRVYGLDSCIFRYFNVYGERSPVSGPYSLVIGIFLSQRKQGKPLTVVGKGECFRDFVYVKDVVEVNVKAMTHEPLIDGDVFNIGFGSNLQILDVARSISQDIVFVPYRQGEARSTCADIAKARAIFNWAPSISLLDWLKTQ